jgi:hypothetical protein
MKVHPVYALLIGGGVLLILVLWQIRRGKSDLLFWLDGGVDVNRKENGIFYWIAIVLQLIVSLGMIALGSIFVFF